MKTNTYLVTNGLAKQKLECEYQLNNFFKYYPIELIEEKIAKLFESELPHESEETKNNLISMNSLFYEELNLTLKNCELLFNRKEEHNIHYTNIDSIISFISEVIPVSYIFCSCISGQRTDLIVITDRYKYTAFNEIYTLLDFAILGRKNINCTVYSYGTMYDFLLKGHLYFSAICSAENCVYQSDPGSSLPKLDQSKCNDLINKSSMLFNQTIHKAVTFYNGAKQFANESECIISAFMLQQACELTYRSLLLSLRGKDLKCHDLVVLRKHLSHFAPTIIGIFNEKEKEELKILTSIQEAYINSRYDHAYKVKLDDLNNSISATHRLIQTGREIFNYHCQKVRLQAFGCS